MISFKSKHIAVIRANIEHNIIHVINTKFGLLDEFILMQNKVAKSLAVPIFADIIETKKAFLYFK